MLRSQCHGSHLGPGAQEGRADGGGEVLRTSGGREEDQPAGPEALLRHSGQVHDVHEVQQGEKEFHHFKISAETGSRRG